MSQLWKGNFFFYWNSYNPTELKSHLLKISRLILQILVMSLSSFICRNLKRRSFTMSYFERNMSIMIKYCLCINFYVCLGYCKLCIGSVSSSVFFQLILLVLEWEGGGSLLDQKQLGYPSFNGLLERSSSGSTVNNLVLFPPSSPEFCESRRCFPCMVYASPDLLMIFPWIWVHDLVKCISNLLLK